MNKSPFPSKYALKFLRWYCREDFLEEIEGDLLELFEHSFLESPKKASRNFTWGVITHFRPDYIKPFHPNLHLIHPAMIRHNLLISYRSFLRNKGSFLINLSGLSVGLAAVLFIFLWAQDELSVDKFHKNGDQLYQVMHNLEFASGTTTWEVTPLPLGKALLEEMPEVEEFVAVNDFFHWESKQGIVSYDETHIQVSGRHATKEFFDVFSYGLIAGKPDQVLAGNQDIVISRRLAKKLFSSPEQALEKFIAWDNPSFKGTFRVSGVFENVPAQSTEEFDVVFTMATLKSFTNDHNLESFRVSYVHTFVLLKEGTDIEQFNQKIFDYMEVKDPVNTLSRLFVQKYTDQYLYGIYDNGKVKAGRITYVRLLSIIGIFLLLIACVNFMNLATAKASTKLKEIGVKKTIGATRKILISQFLSEALLLSIISSTIALVIVFTLLPEFNTITGKQLVINFDTGTWVAICLITLTTGLLAGSYPAAYLSGFKPIAALKDTLGPKTNDTFLRKGLVIFQFTLSALFIVGFLVINRQIHFTQTKNMGYNRNNIISFEWKRELFDPWTGLDESGNSNQAFYNFMEELRELPGVENATNMTRNILEHKDISRQSGITWTGEEAERNFMFISPVVGFNFMETLGIPLKEGRYFSKQRGDDYSKIILNEAAVSLMGLDNPIGKSIDMNEGCQIIGVVKDFHYGSLYNSIEPLIFRCEPHGPNFLVKLAQGAERSTIKNIESLYQGFHPHYSFEYQFMNEQYQNLYESESRVAQLSNYSAGLSILISCMGLLGLAAFMAERRKKEIGIRKVLGASVQQLVQLLSIDFIKMVLISITIAMPIGYLVSNYWLSSFSERIGLQGWYFIAAATLTLFIAWLTVTSQTLLAARIDPVECLKDE
ncbi:MAG: ABC transporter permease [Bacteroidota bacterium]